VTAACVYLVVLGLGMGMVMQVLVLAAQNAVPYESLGVATSATTLFRSIGGSIGVSLFGAVFAGELTARLAGLLPGGAAVSIETAPGAIRALPSATRALYLEAFTASLHPVFLHAAMIGAVAFALTWFLQEVPLRGSAPPAPAPPAPAPPALPPTASRPAPPPPYSERDKLPGGR
jgi:hypothetical protein